MHLKKLTQHVHDTSHANKYWRKKGNLSQCGTRQPSPYEWHWSGNLVNLGAEKEISHSNYVDVGQISTN